MTMNFQSRKISSKFIFIDCGVSHKLHATNLI
jgi:hypothetical protein